MVNVFHPLNSILVWWEIVVDKVLLQTNLEEKFSNSSNIFLLYVNFENLIVELHAFYVLYVKFRSNRMLFTI